MAISTAVVPIAGWGSRLLPVSLLTAKEFLPLGKKPVIQHIAEELADAGIKKIVFVSSARKQSVSNLFAQNDEILEKLTGSKEYLREQLWCCSANSGIEIEVAVQHEQLGLGHAVLCAEKQVGAESFVVALGDCLIGTPGQTNILKTMMGKRAHENAQIAVSFERIPQEQVGKYGVAKPKNEGDIFELEDLVEKPSPLEAPSNLAICGRYILPPSIFAELKNLEPGLGGEIQLTDAIRKQIREGEKAIGVALPDGVNRHDVGDIKTYVKSFVEFALTDSDLRNYVEDAMGPRHRELI